MNAEASIENPTDHSESVASSGQVLLDLGAIVSLTAIAMATFTSTFEGAGWWYVAMAATALGLGASLMVLRWRWPAWTIPVILLVIYLVLASPIVATGSGVALLVPNQSSVANVLRGSFSVWGDLIGTLPLVDSTGTILLVPLMLGLFLPGLAAVLALHTRRSGLPAVPLLVLLVVVLILGRSEQDPRLVHGVVFTVIVVGWISLRGARFSDRRTQHGLVVTTTRIVVVALTASFAPLLVSQVVGDTDRLVLRETVAEGLDTRDIPMPLSGFRRYTQQESGYVDNVHGDKLLTVTGAEPGMRMRFAVLDWYDGIEWRTDPDTSPSDSQNRYLRVSSTLDNPSSGPTVVVHVKVHDAWSGNWVPTAGDLQAFNFSWTGKRNRRSELRYNPATSAALLSSRLRGGDDYDFMSRLPDDDLNADMVPATERVNHEIQERAAFLGELADGWLLAGKSPMASLLKAARSLKRHGRYSDGAFGWEKQFKDGHGIERLDVLFLEAPQMVGNDEQYAAVMALLANRMGIPARVVVGAEVPGSGVVRGKDVHAWVEVQISDRTWRTLDTDRFMSHAPPDRDPVVSKDKDTALKPPPPRAKSPEEIMQDQAIARSLKEKERQRKRAAELESDRSWLWWVLLAALVMAPPAAKSVRRQRRRTLGGPGERIASAWEELVDTARDLGHQVPLVATRPGQATAIGAAAGLASRADLYSFAEVEVGEDDVVEFWDDIRAITRQLASDAPRWRRLSAPLVLRSFILRDDASS